MISEFRPHRPALSSHRPVLAQPTAPPQPTHQTPRPGGLAVQQALRQAQPKAKLSPPPADKTKLARQMPLDMNLSDEAAAHHGLKITKSRRRLVSRSLAVALVLVITLGGLLASQSYFKLNKVFKGSAGTAAALRPNVKPELLKGEGRGRVNILMLGRGGGSHEAPNLTDTIMLASIDPVNNTTTLLSLPRDLWVNVPGKGVMKLNAAWESAYAQAASKKTKAANAKAIEAGFGIVDETVKEVLGLEVDYHVLVDFKAFRQAVDTVGGVNLNVPTDLVDPTMAWENSNNPVLAKAGLQQFSGQSALNYIRSRQTSSDFARAERQRAMLVALKGKVVSLGTLSNPLKVSKLVNAFGDNVQTDLSISNATRLYSIMKRIGDDRVMSVGLTDGDNPLLTTGNINGQSIVLPKAGLYKYGDIHQFISLKLQDPYIVREKAKVMILNGTPMPGLATAKAAELKNYGYNVIGADNASNSGWLSTTLVDLTHKNKYTKNYLEQRFNQSAATSLADTSIPTYGADFVIILGSNEVSSTQH